MKLSLVRELQPLKNREQIKSILITKFKHIGDVLMLTPVVSILKERFPQASICVVVHKGTEAVLTNNPDIDKIIVFDRSLKEKGLFQKIKGQIKLVQQIRDIKPDLSIELTGGDRGAIISLLSGSPIRVGFSKGKKGMLGRNLCFTSLAPLRDNAVHAAQSDLDILNEIGISEDVKNYPLKLYISESDRRKAESVLDQYGITKDDFVVFIHPVSRWFFKCWDDEKVAALCDYLQEKYNAVIILSGGSLQKEKDKIANIRHLSKAQGKTVDLSGQLSLEVLAGVLERSHMFFGVDTALMHMASALLKPMVVLFGPTGAHNWRPLNPQAIVIKKDELGCLPCGKAGCDDSKKSKCLSLINVSDVTEAFDKLISMVA